MTYRGVLVRVHTHAEREDSSSESTATLMTHDVQKAEQPYGILMKDSMGMVPPPHTHTVKNTMRSVVENII